ncbi:hypothetical protein [Brevundimonas sp. NIBR11]|uniref:hypothetical protein n=1 Tax=Brevundimonas sp. NIBR11 TaxID=3015999 RepID=UPI0022F06832|nr:hypothetical protein [Brevundimonas sp. NIBR11]WGM31815.1 hypothetical protein KKHFBJBL_02064 [Brevundimonas sp. NIBR11]
MRILWLPVVLLAALTAACASVETPGPTPAAAVEPSAPAPVAGYDWHFTPQDGAARLAYGVEESDDLRLGLDCVAGSGKIDLTVLGRTGEREIHLESGGETERFAAEGEPSEVHDGDILTASARADAPVMQRFRRVGWIAQWVGGQREVYAPHPGSEAGVERFFAQCG